MHFFNPAAVMKLVEVVSTVATGDEVAETARALCDKVGKVAVSCGDRAGFIVNALLFPYLNDAVKMLEAHYATADDIDTAMKQGCALPMGPFELLDVVGNDVSLAIQRELYLEFREPGFAPAPLLEHLVTAGYLGRKTRRGFRDYSQRLTARGQRSVGHHRRQPGAGVDVELAVDVGQVGVDRARRDEQLPGDLTAGEAVRRPGRRPGAPRWSARRTVPVSGGRDGEQRDDRVAPLRGQVAAPDPAVGSDRPGRPGRRAAYPQATARRGCRSAAAAAESDAGLPAASAAWATDARPSRASATRSGIGISVGAGGARRGRWWRPGSVVVGGEQRPAEQQPGVDRVATEPGAVGQGHDVGRQPGGVPEVTGAQQVARVLGQHRQPYRPGQRLALHLGSSPRRVQVAQQGLGEQADPVLGEAPRLQHDRLRGGASPRRAGPARGRPGRAGSGPPA